MCLARESTVEALLEPIPAGGWRPFIQQWFLRRHGRVSSWRSPLLCVLLHAAVIGLALVGGRLSGWWLAPLAILVIAALQHHLLILLHEAAHGLLHPQRRVNDLLSDLFCAVPFFTLTRFYRRLHLLHHKHAGSADDPERAMYAAMGWRHERLGRAGLLRLFLADLCGMSVLRMAAWSAGFVRQESGRGLAPFGPKDGLLYLAVWGPVVGGSIALGFWPELLLFWLLPLATVTTFVAKLHGYLEHTDVPGPTEYERTLVHELHPLVDFWVYPLRSGWHLEHHLFPRVPWYGLAKVRAVLQLDPEHRQRAAPVTVDGLLTGARPGVPTFMMERATAC